MCSDDAAGRPHRARAEDAVGDGFMSDTLADRSPIRIVTLVDVCTRECVALHVARSFSGTDVAAFRTEAGQRRGKLPEVVQCDQGTEFTAIALDHWA